MSERRRVAVCLGILHVEDIDWQFRVYLMKGDPSEQLDQAALFANLTDKVRIIASQYLSQEYKYMRSGFILAHYGRRGVTYSLWHWADWEGTWEYFCQAWYCYGRGVDAMGPLDRSEPILCQHEIEIVMQEGLTFREIAWQSSNHADLVKRYRQHEPACS